MGNALVIAIIDRGHCTFVDHEGYVILFPQNVIESLMDTIFALY